MQYFWRFAVSYKGSLVSLIPEAIPTPLPFAVLRAAPPADPLLATPEDEDDDEDEDEAEDEDEDEDAGEEEDEADEE